MTAQGMTRAAPYRVIIPTRNSERWIVPFYFGYRRLGIEPTYLLDCRSEDRTEQLLRDIGAHVHKVEPKYDRVEAMLEFTRDLFGSEWVIRVDDDELPSASLLDWLDENISGVKTSLLTISMRHVFLIDHRLCFSRMELFYFHPDHLTLLNPTWRGFIPCRSRFTDAIHTPGVELVESEVVPDSGYLVHFNWLVLTRQERMEKLRRYERQSAGFGWRFAQYYLPELHTPEAARWTQMDTEEFAPLLADLGIA